MASSFDPTALLVRKRIEKKIEKVEKTDAPAVPVTLKGKSKKLSTESVEKKIPPVSPRSPIQEQFDLLTQEMTEEFYRAPFELLKLNRTRREGISRFLAELAKIPEPENPEENLKSFIHPDRSPDKEEALRQLFSQIAHAEIGKSLLLKSWNDEGHLKMEKSDLSNLTLSVERGLRPFIHLTTSTCQLIQTNFFSWVRLSYAIQEKLWVLLNACTDLNSLKDWFLEKAIRVSAQTLGEADRYSAHFYKSLWQAIHRNQLLNPHVNPLLGFSPSLRDGSLCAHAPKNMEWAGFEPLAFELMFSEIRYFWGKPKPPPLWVKGSGLEMSMEPQSNLLLSHSGKKNSLQQIESISGFEIALITEESIIRTQGRTLAAQQLRKQVEEHSVLKKLKQPHTSRGMYQACQALEKLRQGGVLVWAREEVLTEDSGKPALNFLLNDARILMIADFSSLQFQQNQLKRHVPKVLYLLKKEIHMAARKSHRPILIRAYGNIRKTQDVDLLIERTFALVQRPEMLFPPEPFTLQTRVSPMDQREWEQHWFNPTDDHLVDRIEELKRHSVPLGKLAMIRALNPGSTPHFESDRTVAEPELFKSHLTQEKSGFFVWHENNRNGNDLLAAPYSEVPEYAKKRSTLFWVVPHQAHWNVPLQVLLTSQSTRDWLNYSTEQKRNLWLLKEGDLKAVPIPSHIAKYLEHPDQRDFSPRDLKMLEQIPFEPAVALKNLEMHRSQESGHLRGAAFVEAAKAIKNFDQHHSKVFSVVNPDETIDYPAFFRNLIPDQDLCTLSNHPLIRLNPIFAPHQAVREFSETQYPSLGILFVTPKGMTQHIQIQEPWLRARVLDSLQALKTKIEEPTWGEILQNVVLPIHIEKTLQTVNQLLKAYSQEKMKRKELLHFIELCLVSADAPQPRIGLLQ